MTLHISTPALVLGIVTLIALLFHKVVTKAAPPEKRTWLTDYQYAHRGLHNDRYPENSLPAFENAAKHGFAIELDVHITADGEIVVFHDYNLKRMTGADQKMRDCSYSELCRYTLLGTSYKIPTLRETLQLIKGRVPLLIEIKKRGFSNNLERKLYEILREYSGKYAVQSFSPFSIRWFKKHAPQVLRGQLSGNFALRKEDFPIGMSRVVRFFTARLLVLAQRLGLNFLCRPNFISYELQKVNSRLIRRLRQSGAPIFAWTVRNPEEYERAKQYTDSVIFENFTPRLLHSFSWDKRKTFQR